ncbi:MAG: hypothetical protein AAB227_12545 [Pseudomonadota bacterium]
MPYLILSYLPALICGIHVVRTGQNMYWIMLLVIGGPLGALIYFFAIMLPDLTGGRTARKVTGAASRLIDPERDYKQALKRLDDSPTVDARMKAAHAAAAIGRWEDAERMWSGSATGRWAEDPTILLGHARALIELSRFEETLARLEQLQKLGGREAESPQAALTFARAYEGLGRNEEAEEPYRFAADRLPGLEAGARYVAFMAKTGRLSDAETGLAELNRRLAKISPALRGEARVWRDLAAKEISDRTGKQT